jgi:hypothetical protein
MFVRSTEVTEHNAPTGTGPADGSTPPSPAERMRATLQEWLAAYQAADRETIADLSTQLDHERAAHQRLRAAVRARVVAAVYAGIITRHQANIALTEWDLPPVRFRYRVHGSLPLVVTLTADSAEVAASLAGAAVTDALTGRDDVRLYRHEFTVGAAAPADPGPAPHPDGVQRYAVPVTARGHIDIAADDHVAAQIAAIAQLRHHLTTAPAGAADVAADVDRAVCTYADLIDDGAATAGVDGPHR